MATAAKKIEHAPPVIGYPGLAITLPGHIQLTDELLLQLSSDNGELRFEISNDGELLVMTPSGVDSSTGEGEVFGQLFIWAKQDGSGRAFGATAGFRIGKRAIRSPDASWVSLSRLKEISPQQRKSFFPLCPDFLIELRSPSDSLAALKRKMAEYVSAGVRLAWLIDPVGDPSVYIYGQGDVRQLKRPATLSAEPILGGFVLDLQEIWPAPESHGNP